MIFRISKSATITQIKDNKTLSGKVYCHHHHSQLCNPTNSFLLSLLAINMIFKLLPCVSLYYPEYSGYPIVFWSLACHTNLTQNLLYRVTMTLQSLWGKINRATRYTRLTTLSFPRSPFSRHPIIRYIQVPVDHLPFRLTCPGVFLCIYKRTSLISNWQFVKQK